MLDRIVSRILSLLTLAGLLALILRVRILFHIFRTLMSLIMLECLQIDPKVVAGLIYSIKAKQKKISIFIFIFLIFF